MASAIDAAALAAAKALRDSAVSDRQVEAIAHQVLRQQHGRLRRQLRQRHGVQRPGRSPAEARSRSTSKPTCRRSSARSPASTSSVAEVRRRHLRHQGHRGRPAARRHRLDARPQARVDLKDAPSQTVGEKACSTSCCPTPAPPTRVRIGLAPFAAGVNAGDYAARRQRRPRRRRLRLRAPQSRRPGTEARCRSAPLRSKARAPTFRGAGACPSEAKVIAMTDDKVTLRDEINSWDASTVDGRPPRHRLGLVPALAGVVGDLAGGRRPAAYGDGRTMKVAILMTDGIYNTVGGRSDGDHGATAAQSARFATDTCAAMRAKGVIVYTIGFEAPNAAKHDPRDLRQRRCQVLRCRGRSNAPRSPSAPSPPRSTTCAFPANQEHRRATSSLGSAGREKGARKALFLFAPSDAQSCRPIVAWLRHDDVLRTRAPGAVRRGDVRSGPSDDLLPLDNARTCCSVPQSIGRQFFRCTNRPTTGDPHGSTMRCRRRAERDC